MVSLLGGLMALFWGTLLIFFVVPSLFAVSLGASLAEVLLLFSPVLSLAVGFYVGVKAFFDGRVRLAPLVFALVVPALHLQCWWLQLQSLGSD